MSTPDSQQPSEPPRDDVQIPGPQAGVSFDKPAAPAPAPPHEQPTTPTYAPQAGLPYDPLPGQAYDPRTGLPLGPPPGPPYAQQGAAAYNAPYGYPPAYGPPYQGGYPPPGYGAYAPRPTNGMAIASLVLGILWIYWLGSVLALAFGYVARQQIAQRGESGDGIAIAGIVLGWIGVGILVLIMFVMFAGAAATGI